MKKVILFPFIFTLSAFSANAQLKVLSNGSTQGGSTHGALRIETDYRYVDIGCNHSSGDHTHFITNSNYGFYFNKGIEVVGGKYSSFTGPLTLATRRNAQVWVLESGRVGIGDATPSYKLDVDGDIATYGVLRISSDQRLKKEIKDVNKERIQNLYFLNAKTYKKDNSLVQEPSLKSAKPVEGDFTSSTDTSDIEIIVENDTTTKIGFIAQELKEYYPELVSMDNKGYYNIDYVSLIPVLVEALKEQNSRIAELENKEKGLKLKNAESDEIINPSEGGAMLMQNVPNPFSENTVIEFYLPGEVKKAMLCVYDLQGKQVKSINIAEREYGSAVIYGSELLPGMYHYSLIADGELIGIEKMTLTD